MQDVEVENKGCVSLLHASYGAGSGSRAADRGSRGRSGQRNANRGSLTRTRNRIAAAQASNRGRGSRARRQTLNDLATAARGNARGNVRRRQLRDIQRQIAQVERALRGNA